MKVMNLCKKEIRIHGGGMVTLMKLLSMAKYLIAMVKIFSNSNLENSSSSPLKTKTTYNEGLKSDPTDDKAKENWHIGCKTGWTFYMANMKSMLEGGIDLRNKNEKIQNVITA